MSNRNDKLSNNANASVDHRQIGVDMDLFSFHDEAPGFPFYKENFLIIRDELLNFLKEEQKKLGYQQIETPIILRNDLWIASGHWDYYKDNMYWIEQENDLIEVIKPMNCPGGVLIYKEKIHSYRELPLKIAEFGRIHRKELSGTIQGVFRTRGLIQDDAHIYLEKHQINEIIHEVMDLIELIYGALGFKYKIYLSTRPEKSIGSEDNWQESITILQHVLDDRKTNYQIKEGEGAFYGPKIDFDIADSLERNWQCGTIQLDFNLPERFDLIFQNEDGKKERVFLVHRAIFGGAERLIAILLEHFKGKLPLWLSPVQIMLINVRKENLDYLKDVKMQLDKHGFRVEIDDRNESIEKKIREGSIRKINYFLIIGDKEVKNKSISVRRRDNKRFNDLSLEKFINQLLIEKNDKKILDY
ncbi:MAG: threonine--tRNA ligase [Asgard group archaeon]|nr:threonine--tRNA ligase [Asgard group archaeon]